MYRRSYTPGAIKIVLLLGASLFFSGCADDLAVSQLRVERTATPQNSNQITVGNVTPLSKEDSDAIDREKQKEAEKLKNIPDEFKNIDFKNFSYRSNYLKKQIKLKDGEFEYTESKGSGGGWFSFDDVYFVDLTKDKNKEAIIFLYQISCGASCDGGSALIYVFQSGKQKPALIWHYELGSFAYGCGLKAFTVKETRISFEVFGKCDDEMEDSLVEGDYPRGKYAFTGFTDFSVEFDEGKFIPKRGDFHPTAELDAVNYSPEISISD